MATPHPASSSRTQPVADLVQGVSQQAAQQRRDAQCEAQFDCINSVSDGAASRPHFEVVKVWTGRDWSGGFFREAVHDSEQYLVGVVGAAPVAINLDDGTDCAITGSNTDGYLDAEAGVSPRDQFRSQAVEDTTIILSRSVAPAMDTALSPAVTPKAIVFVRGWTPDAHYVITLTKLDGTAYTYDNQSSSASDDSRSIAKALQTLIAAGTATSGFSVTRSASCLLIYRADGADFHIETEDGNGDDFMYAVKDTVSAFTKLPARGFDGFTVKVRGERKEEADDYYVRFTGDSAVGYWDEVVAPATPTNLKASTLPHLLVNTGLNAFSYGTGSWSTRIAGDEDSAKDPSFIGKKCRDVFYHENRLAILYNGGAVWSKSRFPYTFFPDTAQVTLANAPVDSTLVAGSTSRGASQFDFAVQIDETLSLWATRAQFRISSGQDPFKQDTISAKVSTAYEYATQCDPLALGQVLYFGTDVGQYATVRSVQFSGGRSVGDVDITAHVPKYLPSGIRWLVASDTLRCMFAVSDNELDAIYLYNWLLQQTEYYQSAWNKWRVPGGDILWIGVYQNQLRILQQRPEGLALLKANLTPKAVDDVAGAQYATRLDLRVTEAQVTGLTYDSATDTSTFTLPYTPTGPDLRVIVAADRVGGFTRGREFKVLSVVGAAVTVQGDLTGYSFYAGQRITALRQESRFYIRGQTGVVPTDRLTVNSFSLEFSDTGYTRIEVAVPGKPTRQIPWEGRTAGLPDSQIGTPMLGTDSITAPVEELAENATITLINDSFLPSYWQSASYDYLAVGKAGQR